jgi:hypothetical protein
MEHAHTLLPPTDRYLVNTAAFANRVVQHAT